MGFDPSGLTAYVNGEFVAGGAASVSIFDHGFMYGDGVFEGMRLFDGGLFRPRDHLARLARSARTIGLELPLEPAALLELICEVVRRSELRDAHIRPIVTRGFGGPGIDPRSCEGPSLIVSAYPFPPFLGAEPVRLMTSAIARKAPRSLGAHVKSLNYLDGIMAKQQAIACGMDDALMLDGSGAVAESTGANVFLIRDGGLVTPTTRAALPGITRRTVLEIAREEGIPAVEEELFPMDFYGADGAFVCGSGAGIVPVGALDGRALVQPRHPLVTRLQELYRERTRRADHRVEVDPAPVEAR
jgi:branched-chain amino acid aminotransferase